MADWYVGTMGFGYKPWAGAFYPENLPRNQQLTYYAGVFNALEMDSTFYGTPRTDSVTRWRSVTADNFRFCPKAPRAITHDQRLLDVDDTLSGFLETMQILGDRLGPVVFQFPPDYRIDQRDSLKTFLQSLPSGFRYAVELRHRSWWSEATADLLREANVCWIAADYIYLPKEIRRTTDFLYLRFLGRHGQFATKTHELVDKTADLERWRSAIEPHLEHVTAVYAFFNDDYAGFSPATANRFKRILGLEAVDEKPSEQGKLF